MAIGVALATECSSGVETMAYSLGSAPCLNIAADLINKSSPDGNGFETVSGQAQSMTLREKWTQTAWRS